MNSLKELKRKKEINRLEGEILTWKIFMMEGNLSNDDLSIYARSIKSNQESLRKLD